MGFQQHGQAVSPFCALRGGSGLAYANLIAGIEGPIILARH
ncbi:MAG: hypothetical protein QGI08_00775 [Paracoccaceae bacterium]|nr:hypothetical protein [Paracoccaceae bacterium]